MHKTNLKSLFSLSFPTSCARQHSELSFAFAERSFLSRKNENFPFLFFLQIAFTRAMLLMLLCRFLCWKIFHLFFPREFRKLSGRSSCTMLYLINIIFCSLRLPFLLIHRTHHSTSARVFALCQVRFFSYLQLSDLHFFSVFVILPLWKIKKEKNRKAFFLTLCYFMKCCLLFLIACCFCFSFVYLRFPFLP